MEKTLLEKIGVAVRGIALALGAAFLLGYLAIAALRMTYPFQLEWMEGGMLDHVRMAASGQKIFAEPSLEFVSFLYPPLYYYVAAVSTAIFGMELHALRAVSFASSLGCLALIFAFVRREGGGNFSAALAACLYAATFDRSGGWLDIARVDSLFMVLLLGGLYGVAFARARSGLVLAGILLGCAALTKQSAVVICLPLGLYALIWDRRRGIWWAGAALIFSIASWGLLDVLHDGWFRYYCFTIPRLHPFVSGQLAGFWTHDMLPLTLAVVASVFFVAAPRLKPEFSRRLFYAALAVGMLGSSWSVTSAVGAWHNNLLPAFAAVSILAGLGLRDVLERVEHRKAWVLTTWLLVVAQFAMLAYDPRDHLPTAADRVAGESLLQRLRAIDGEVFIPHHGYLARRAGKRPQAHTLGMDNIFLDDPGPVRIGLQEEMLRALGDGRYAVAILESDGRYLPGIQRAFEPAGRVFADSDVFWPVTGARLRPEYVYRSISK